MLARRVLYIHSETLKRALLAALIALKKNSRKQVHLIHFLFPFVIFEVLYTHRELSILWRIDKATTFNT